MSSIHRPDKIELELNRGADEELPFYCVSTAKFALLSFVSFGLYEIFWFYKNWVLIKARSGHDISPFWRAIFSPFHCYAFATAVDSGAQSMGLASGLKPGLIAMTYAGLFVLERLPDPYWLLCLFTFVPLIPVVRQIRTVHEAIRPGFDSAAGWNRWSYLTLGVGSILCGLTVIGLFAPPTRALRDSEIPDSYQTTLVEAAVLDPEERIQFFYSTGFFSILEDGNLLTQDRVVSYETVDGEMYVASAAYSEIQDFGVTYSEGFFEDTIITVSTLSGDEFILFVSAEEGRDRDFVSRLESRIPLRP